MSNMKFINFQTDKLDRCDRLNEVDKAQLLDCIASYARSGEEPSEDDVSPVVDVLFHSIKGDMDFYDEKYRNRCDLNRRNGALGGRPSKNKPMAFSENHTESDGLLVEPKEKREKGKEEKQKKEIENNLLCSTQSIERKQETKIKEAEERFETWWNSYDKKVGRAKAFKKWLRLSEKDQEKCIEVAPSYVSAQPNKQYRKDPTTYLNGECWNDEIIDKYGSKSSNITETRQEKIQRLIKEAQHDKDRNRRGWIAPQHTDEEYLRLNRRPEGYMPDWQKDAKLVSDDMLIDPNLL